MIAGIHELADRVRAAPARAGGTRVVAVDGPAGSGKSTFAARLSAALGAPVVHLDDLIPGWTGLDQPPRGSSSGYSRRWRPVSPLGTEGTTGIEANTPSGRTYQSPRS